MADGWPWAKIATDLLSDGKIRRMHRRDPGGFDADLGVWLQIVVESWRIGSREIEDLGLDPERLAVLRSVGLLDRKSRIPEAAWVKWTTQAREQREAIEARRALAREYGRKGGLASVRGRTEAPVRSPRGRFAPKGGSVEPVKVASVGGFGDGFGEAPNPIRRVSEGSPKAAPKQESESESREGESVVLKEGAGTRVGAPAREGSDPKDDEDLSLHAFVNFFPIPSREAMAFLDDLVREYGDAEVASAIGEAAKEGRSKLLSRARGVLVLRERAREKAKPPPPPGPVVSASVREAVAHRERVMESDPDGSKARAGLRSLGEVLRGLEGGTARR